MKSASLCADQAQQRLTSRGRSRPSVRLAPDLIIHLIGHTFTYFQFACGRVLSSFDDSNKVFEIRQDSRDFVSIGIFRS